MKNELFRMSKKELVLHLLFWLVLMGSLIFAWSDNQLTMEIICSRLGTWTLAIILPIYINAFILIPKYLNKANWPKYILSLFAILIIAKLFHTLLLILPLIIDGRNIDFVSEFSRWFLRDFKRLDQSLFSGSAMILGLSFAYRFGKDWVVNERVKEKLKAKNIAMELALLKTQVNPHFLFNVLNNIYSTALEENAANTADYISKLGTLMRYSLHDSQVDFISLNKEIDYIERYIEMQKMRLTDSDKISINIKLDATETTNLKITPMILIPFIENAFKYGVSTAEKSSIKIEIIVLGEELNLHVQNTIHAKNNSSVSGIGLANAESRLNLIYPNRYTLVNEAKEKLYEVNLVIKL